MPSVYSTLFLLFVWIYPLVEIARVLLAAKGAYQAIFPLMVVTLVLLALYSEAVENARPKNTSSRFRSN
jgi:hypothetical protein